MSNTEITSEEIDTAAKALSAVPGLKDLDAGIVAKLEKLERGILYRMFYFPGGIPPKYITGVGKDTPEVHYDGHTEQRYALSDWDPRYLDDYIMQAKQNGFHKHFLYYDGELVQHISFGEAIAKLGVVDPTLHPFVYYGILEGLTYMNKVPSFLADAGVELQLTETIIKNQLNAVKNTLVPKIDRAINAVIGQSKDDFIKNDVGWLASDEAYAFASDLYPQWRAMQDQYNEYKNKLWEALKEIDNLNLCTNNVSGILVGANVQQSMECLQTINGHKNDLASGSTPTSSTTPTPTASTTIPATSSTSASTIPAFSKDDNGVPYHAISGKQIVEIITRIPNDGNLRYLAKTNTDDRCYLTHELKVINANGSFISGSFEVPNNVLMNKDGVPYYLHQTLSETPAVKVISIISDEVSHGSIKYIGKLNNNINCYISYDVNNAKYVPADASCNTDYNDIELPARLITDFISEKEIVTKNIALQEEKEENSISMGMILTVIALIAAAVIIYMVVKKKNRPISRGYIQVPNVVSS